MNACPIPGCGTHARAGQLMCPPHWQQVQYKLKTAVWSTWRAIRHPGSAEGGLIKTTHEKLQAYTAARQAAIDAVVAAESPLLSETSDAV